MTRFHRFISRFPTFSNFSTLRWLPVFAALAAATGALHRRRGKSLGRLQRHLERGVRHHARQLQLRLQRPVPGDGNPGVVGRRRQGLRHGQPRGAVAVNVSVGASKASGGGRLAGTSGAGSWSGIITGDRCSGTWQATRS